MIYDYLIIGAGVAGLSAARYIPSNKRAIIVCKRAPWESNTFYAQGGIAAAVDENDIASHVADTLEAGSHLNNIKAVETLSKNSIDVIKDLVNSGMPFDLDNDNKIALTKEAAHSRARIVHADGDATGRILHMFLLKNCEHEIVTDANVIDLLIQNDLCYGAQMCIGGQTRVIYAHNTILASGGVGSVYKYHTNSVTVAGDIQGICIEKGFELDDMEMMQFHPTVFLKTNWARKTLLTEALRGEGAYVVDENGKRFLFDYHKDGELAPRDLVSRAIYEYSKKNNCEVYLSFENFKKKAFQDRFPNIYRTFRELGYELPFERVPISPAFHYSMGGVKTNLDAQVLGMKNLYAVGEVACTGVHGANRLASNSLLEGLVFAKLAISKATKENIKIDLSKYSKPFLEIKLVKTDDKEIKNELRTIMWEKVGIVRTKKELQEALEFIHKFLKMDIGRLLYLRLLTSKSIIEAAIKREKSIGAHFIKENGDD